MKTPQRPTPINAQDVANTQLGYNQQAAQSTAQMNRVDQVGPTGSVRYTVNGTNPDGTPRYQQTTSFNPETQALFDTNTNTAQALATAINAQAGNPFSLDNAAVEGRLNELGSARLAPRLARERTATEADLLNRGLVMGSEAYNNAMGRVGENENGAWNQLYLTGRQQAVNELLTQRNQPYEELARIMGAQPGTPQFGAPVPQAQVASPDYQGAVGQQYQAELNDYNQRIAQQNAMLGGLFGLGGTLAGGAARTVPGMFGGWR